MKLTERRKLWLDPRGKHGGDCYICKEEIGPKAIDWGFTWGSDGFFPDGASAMYCCWNCRAFWIDPPEPEAGLSTLESRRAK